MYVGDNNSSRISNSSYSEQVDELRVRSGLQNIAIQSNQPLSALRTSVVKQQQINQFANGEDNLAVAAASAEIARSEQLHDLKAEKLRVFQQTISDRAGLISRENKQKKLEEERVKEEKKAMLLSRNKRVGKDGASLTNNDSFFAQNPVKPSKARPASAVVETKKPAPTTVKTTPTIVFKPNEVISKPVKKTMKQSLTAHQGRAQILIPVVAEHSESDDDENEDHFDICNFADADEAVQKYADIRQHLAELTAGSNARRR